MKIIYTLFISIFLQTSTAFAQDEFVAGFEDLPLMSGLKIEQEELYFDTPTGKIVESYAYSEKLTTKEVLDFYKNTLPQLGWKAAKSNQYSREGELLTIEASTTNSILNVKFFLQPVK